MRLASLVAGLFGIHRLGGARFLLSAILAIPAGWALHYLGGFPLFVLACLALALSVLWAAPRSDATVISDRFAGQLMALAPLSGGLWFAGVPAHVFPWPGWVGAFVLFNAALFLPPIRRLSRLGVLTDDLAAAALSSAAVLVSASISHGWFG